MTIGEVQCLIPRAKTTLVSALDMNLKRAREAHEKAKAAGDADAATALVLNFAPFYRTGPRGPSPFRGRGEWARR